MGKIDIDYSKLHDAFFRWQTKPKMSMHGDLYYEGKVPAAAAAGACGGRLMARRVVQEMETKLGNRKPGNLSKALKESLGMPTLEVWSDCDVLSLLCRLTCDSGAGRAVRAATVAAAHAALWPPSFIPQPHHSWTQQPHPTGKPSANLLTPA